MARPERGVGAPPTRRPPAIPNLPGRRDPVRDGRAGRGMPTRTRCRAATSRRERRPPAVTTRSTVRPELDPDRGRRCRRPGTGRGPAAPGGPRDGAPSCRRRPGSPRRARPPAPEGVERTTTRAGGDDGPLLGLTDVDIARADDAGVLDRTRRRRPNVTTGRPRPALRQPVQRPRIELVRRLVATASSHRAPHGSLAQSPLQQPRVARLDAIGEPASNRARSGCDAKSARSCHNRGRGGRGSWTSSPHGVGDPDRSSVETRERASGHAKSDDVHLCRVDGAPRWRRRWGWRPGWSAR